MTKTAIRVWITIIPMEKSHNIIPIVPVIDYEKNLKIIGFCTMKPDSSCYHITLVLKIIAPTLRVMANDAPSAGLTSMLNFSLAPSWDAGASAIVNLT